MNTPDIITIVQSLGHSDSGYVSFDGLYVYACEICHHVNHVKRIHCESCGTIPANYSLIKRPSILNQNDQPIEVVNAHGCVRLESRRNHRVYFRTVPADYYADC